MQGCLEAAVAHVADHPARVTCSGRTDSGVHALGQVAHFDSEAERSERSWILGLNSHLPPGVSVLWIRPVDDSFHARFSAFSRSYRSASRGLAQMSAPEGTILTYATAPGSVAKGRVSVRSVGSVSW